VTELGARLRDCDEPLCTAYDVALLDLDGVLYLGPDAVPHAAASVADVAARGMRTAYVTNNASRAPQAVAAQLTELGIPARPEDVVTSGQAAARLVRDRVPAGSVVLVVGSAALCDEVADAGLRPVRRLADAGDGGPAAVVQGLAADTTWRDLADAAVAIRRGALWVTGNLDATLPTPDGPLPGNGSMVAAVRTATGVEPLVAGKPEPALHEESVRRTAARRPLVVGDRLDTDVLGAVRAGTDSLLVLTGVADVAALLGAPVGTRPSYVAPDLRGLLRPQPPVQCDADTARCGRATAVRRGDALEVTDDGPDDGIASLRAACALAWAGLDHGAPVTQVVGLAPVR
jgi:glycerol 3-phosphatase-2